MHLKRDRIIRNQILLNVKRHPAPNLLTPTLNRLQQQAHQQFSLAKITSREMDYSKIELFLLVATQEQLNQFYSKVKQDLTSLFRDEQAQKTVQQKWTHSLKHNIMGCFGKIASDLYQKQNSKNKLSIGQELLALYIDTIDKLLTHEKMSRIEEKFIEPFLLFSIKFNPTLDQVIGRTNYDRLRKNALLLSKNISQRETPKSITSNQFLKYCAMRALEVSLPHDKYLHNQLLHAPNPKYLLPFRAKGTFLALTNELLLKSNKLDLVACLFWTYYEYQQGDIYERIRRAAEWGGRVDILLMLIRPKLAHGLERCLNQINEKVFYFSTKHITEEGLNSLLALAEIAIQICTNKQGKDPLFDSALQKVDIGQLFQHHLLMKQIRIRPFVVTLLKLYFLLLHLCSKRALKMKFIPHLALQITRLLESQNDQKFTDQIIAVILSACRQLDPEERAELLYGIVDTSTHDWESKQQLLTGYEIALMSVHSVRLLGMMVAAFGFSDEGKTEFKVLKLQFYYVLALNYKQSGYFQSKQKLSRTELDINPSLANNSIFGVLQTRKGCHQAFQAHLITLYGEDIKTIGKVEHEGLLAVIDEVVTYRIQETKSLACERNSVQVNSFYALLVGLLEQVQRVDSQGKLLTLVNEYFQKCIKTYLIEVDTLKGRDESRTHARALITQDVSYLIEGCVSANPNLHLFCWQILQDYINRIPELAIYTEVLVVWAECISILYRKSNQEYQSKSERLRGRGLTSNTPIPTQRKQILSRIRVLMLGLYRVVLRGHMIASNYLGVRVQYLIRQNCKSASFGFGWKLLKHLINSFKEDREFINKQVLTNNSCSWFVNEDYFNRQLQKLEPEKILLDKYLIPLHKGDVDKTELKKIFTAVEPQVETEFVTIPPHSSEGEAVRIVRDLSRLCQQIEDLQLSQPLKEDHLEELYSQVFDVISRVKMIYITKWNQAVIFSQILHVCSKFFNFRLLEHILLKIVPFFYCINEYNSKIMETLAELLHFVVNQLNISCLMPTSVHLNAESNTFDARRDQFNVLQDYQSRETKTPGNRHKVLTCHQRRVDNLKAMYGELVRFISEHLHVCIAKGFPLALLLRVASISFLFQKSILPHLPLQSICKALLSQLQLVNVLKSALEKGETAFDGTMVDNFYVKTIKSALFHFQKVEFSEDQLVSSTFHNKQLKERINFLIQICDYLRNDDFHQLSNKKLPKRNEIYAKKQQDFGSVVDRMDLSGLRNSVKESTRKNKFFTIDEGRSISASSTEAINLTTLRYSLLYLISEQIDRIKAYSYPPLSEIHNPYSLAGKKGYIPNSTLEELLNFLTPRKGAKLIYNIISTFGDRIQNPEVLLRQLRQLLTLHPIYNYPSFLPLFIEEHKHEPEKLRELNYWRSPHIPILLQYLSQQYENYPALQRYVTKVLGQLEADQILFYLPQIFQALTLSSGKIVFHFLLQYARKSSCFGHQLIWLAKVEGKQEKDPHNKSPRLPGVDENLAKLGRMAKQLIKKTIYQFNREQKAFFHEVDNFYEQVTSISGKMSPKMLAADKKDIIRTEVEKIKPPKSAYLPFNTNYQVISINEESGTPMQSAAKCPFLLTFRCMHYSGPDAYFAQRKTKRLQKKFTDQQEEDLPQESIPPPMQSLSIQGSRFTNPTSSILKMQLPISLLSNQSQTKNKKKNEEREISCIFKVFDDIRQDCLALQVIRLFLEIFQRHSLDLKLFPYRTLSNRTGASLDIGGIIEVVPNCVSRDSIGKTNEESLYEFFLNNFGAQHNTVFQSARQNFIRSQAAYSIVSYILQVKDRHNGNIMIDKQQGYLVHIDFGFILEISPANNLRFQRAAFKLTDQMIRIMGGSIQAQPFQLYLTLVIKGFLLARRYHSHIENMVGLMVRSGLPCFLPEAMQNLRKRFFLGMSQIEAASQMKDLVLSAADHWTTNWYDRIQWMQQKIYH